IRAPKPHASGRAGQWWSGRRMNVRKHIFGLAPPLIPLIVIVVSAEVAVRRGWIAAWLVPAPSQVVTAMISERSDLWRAIWSTTVASLTGYALSALGGVIIAIALSSATWVQRAFYPYAVFFQTVPIIAIAPLLVIWVGWDRTVMTSAFIVSIFPVIAN